MYICIYMYINMYIYILLISHFSESICITFIEKTYFSTFYEIFVNVRWKSVKIFYRSFFVWLWQTYIRGYSILFENLLDFLNLCVLFYLTFLTVLGWKLNMFFFPKMHSFIAPKIIFVFLAITNNKIIS